MLNAHAAIARDRAPQTRVHHVIQGEWAIADAPRVVLCTLLGSCVAACVWDPTRGIGGLNHFLLPGTSEIGSGEARYGAYAMELLLNDLYRRGAARGNLRAKLFGGAYMGTGRDIGAMNARFAIDYLREEGIAHAGGSLGGRQGRRVEFWPQTGRARQRLMAPGGRVIDTEAGTEPARTEGGDVELF